jgi:hypothetical protein
MAVLAGNIDVLRVLLNERAREQWMKCAVDVIAMVDNVRARAHMHTRMQEGRTPLHYAALVANVDRDYQYYDLLVASDADVKAVDSVSVINTIIAPVRFQEGYTPQQVLVEKCSVFDLSQLRSMNVCKLASTHRSVYVHILLRPTADCG